jgi:hypothetical protein
MATLQGDPLLFLKSGSSRSSLAKSVLGHSSDDDGPLFRCIDALERVAGQSFSLILKRSMGRPGPFEEFTPMVGRPKATLQIQPSFEEWPARPTI